MIQHTPLAESLRHCTGAELRDRLAAGHAIDPRALDDSEYVGVSLGLPGFIEKLSWVTFVKTFHRDPATALLRGWNVRLEQRGIAAELAGDARAFRRRSDGEPMSFGHYRVVDNERGIGTPTGLLIDYSFGGGGPFSLMRDPLVALESGSVEALLGWSYVSIFGLTIGTPSYFLLVRAGALSHRASP
ncbi:MAG: hypothetical protein ACHREM_19355 [Polyangiales bacterium]